MKAVVLDPRDERQRPLKEVFALQGDHVTFTRSVAELVAAKRAEGHHLVVVAAEVIRAEGLPLAQQLRRPGEEGSCAILALAEEGDADLPELLAAGVDDVVCGPFQADAFASRIVVAKHRLKRGLRRERWFEALIALGATVYTVTDARGIVLYTSPTLTALSGFRPEDIVGRSAFELVIPEDRETAHRIFNEIVSDSGRTGRAQLRCWNEDGTQNIVELTVRNCLDDPLIGGMIITSTDVTKQRETESALEKSQTRYRTLVEVAREGIAICDAEETLTFVNPAFAELLGYERDELTGMNLRELTDADEFERLRRATEERRGGTASRYELCLHSKQKGVRTISLSATPLFSDSGEFVGSLGLATDITDRKREAERLRDSEERYRFIAENVSDVIWTRHLPEPVAVRGLSDRAAAEAVADTILQGLRASYVSPSVTRMLGYTVSEALSHSVRDILTERSYAHLHRFIVSALLRRDARPTGPVTLELEYLTKDGKARWGEITGDFLWDDEGCVVGSLVVARDITERRQIEEALLDSEHRLRRLIENMPDFVVLVDENAEIHYVNRGVGDLGPEQLIGRLGFGFLTEDYHPVCRAAFAAALETGDVQYVEAQDIFGFWWSCRLVPLKEKSIATHVMIICTDMTEERRATETVRKEQDLLRQLIELHERDRKVLAFELHDGFAQQLTGAMMSLEVASRLSASAPEEAAGRLQEAMQLLRESISESRRLVSGLRPPVLDEFGIVAAVEHLVNLYHGDDQLGIEFVSRGRSRRLAAPLENALFRIVQETLANTRRHSESRRAVVELGFDDEQVCLEVRDWGHGFEPATVRETCFGLRGIRERARLLGGRAEIQSAPGEGTTVRVSLPMIEPRPEEASLPEREEWYV